MSYIRDQFDSDSDDDFWTHEDDKLLNPNFEIDDSGTSTSSRSRPKLKIADNKAGSSDLSEDLDSVRAVDSTNALDQTMENLNSNQQNSVENHFEIFSDDFSADDDQAVEKIIQSQAFRRSERERKASKLAERIIQYDLRKKMLRANVIVKNKFAYKKVSQCYTHMIKVLITLINSDDRSNSSDQSDESQTLNEATQRADWSEWEAVMRTEFNSLIENHIWDLIKRLSQNVIIDRWTFRLKRDRDENLQRYKVRWVTHDFKQRHEVDFDETFVSVVKFVSYKTLMTISIIRELQIRHMNVVIAFLYELLDEDVYVIQSHMFEFEKNEDDTLVCKLKRALYDLKQTSKMWYDIIHKFLIELEFKRSNSDHAVFIDSRTKIYLAMYVDDLLLFDLNLNDLYEIQNQLKQRFKMTNLRQLFHYLDMKIIINFNRDQLMLTQSIYLKKILKQFEMNEFKLVSISMKSEMINSLMSVTNEADNVIVKWYQQLSKSLMWSAMHTRFDLAYSVKVFSRYAHNLSSTHCALVKRMLRYIADTINVDLTFNQSDDLIDYSDSDFVELKNKRHSTEDYVFMLADEAISHSFKQQFIIALSSCEIEYMTLSKTAKEAIWIRQFLHELKFRNDDQFVLIFADNKSAIDLIINSLYHKRTKRIEMRWHWIREMMNRKKIILRYLLINEMIADNLIKSSSVSAFSKFRIMLNLSSWLIEKKSQ